MKFSDYCRSNALNTNNVNNALNEASFGKQIAHIKTACSEAEKHARDNEVTEFMGSIGYILNCVALELKNSDEKDIQNVSKRLFSEVDVLLKYSK